MLKIRLRLRPLPLTRMHLARTLFSTSSTSNHLGIQDKPVYITTPIFYVNAVPHIGHLYSAVLADTLKRYHELHGRKVILSTGTDEHGMKIQQAAEKNKETPRELCDRVSQRFRQLFDAGNISYTTYIRTTDQQHAPAVAELWNRLSANGSIYKGTHEGWYSVSDEAFYTQNQVHEKIDEKTGEKYMASIETGQRVEWTSEVNYKFRLSAYRDKLVGWLRENPDAIVPPQRHREILSWLEAGTGDLSVSRPRARLDWGLPVPGDSEHTVYVWLDALTNYLTVTGFPSIQPPPSLPPQVHSTNSAWPADVHIVGKDILRFHSVYWPAFLMAAGLPLPRKILAHAHWTMGRQKMSKSRGNVADPFEVLEKFGVDAVRYYLIRDGGIADDGDYSEQTLGTVYKKELAGQLGNLLNRATSSTLNPTGTVPALKSEVDERDRALHAKLEGLPASIDNHFQSFDFSKAVRQIFDTIGEANKYFNDNAPWSLTEDTQRRDQVVGYALESVRIAALLLQPVMPGKMAEVLDCLGTKEEDRVWDRAKLGAGGVRKVCVKKVVFPKL
ncbi:uncharacterized protein VTP21DRAFT_9345 [Calcarisporiella thermophila]|uniref:uncharacterized protein n=1 Tax=Calcarisporiella thermophila TaxID=911321 RepID=UPI0037438112